MRDGPPGYGPRSILEAGRALREGTHRAFDFRGIGRWLLIGTVLGVVAGLGAIVFQMSFEFLRLLCFRTLMGVDPGHPGGEPPDFVFPLAARFTPWLMVLLPALGGLGAGLLVHFLAPEARGHGTDAAILAYHRRGGLIRKRVPLVKLAATVLSMGTGGSGGREGPIAQIGAGFGSFLATRMGMGVKYRRWLLAAGLGAGVGAIFRAPLAGAIFAAEVLYSTAEVETEVILPAAVTSIVAYAVFAAKYGYGQMFTRTEHFGFSNPQELGPYLVLAIVVAAVALLYIKVFYGTEGLFRRLRMPAWLKPVLGGALTGGVGLLLYLQVEDHRVVDVLSTGYGILQDVIGQGPRVGIAVLLLVAFGKILTTSLTIGSGGSAGVFGPSMVIGGTLGAAVGQVFHLWMPGIVSHPSSFAVVGMAGFFAAAAKTPLSTVIMVSEMTGNYELLVPAVWVCSLAFLVSRRWSIYRSQVPSKVHSPAHFTEYAMQIMGSTLVGDVYKKDRKFVTIPQATPAADVLKATADTRQRVFPVVDERQRLVGSFHVGELLHLLHDEPGEARTKTAGDLVAPSSPSIAPDEPVATAQWLMTSRGVDELVVTLEEDPAAVLGVLTSADVLMAYNRRLAQVEDVNHQPELPLDESMGPEEGASSAARRRTS